MKALSIIKLLKGPLVAFLLGVLFLALVVTGVEAWYGEKLRNGEKYYPEKSQLLSIAELKAKYPSGIYPEAPPRVPEEKQYHVPLIIPRIPKQYMVYLPDTRTTYDSYRHILKDENGKVLWDIPFYLDHYKRRRVPADLNKTQASQYITFLGDSNILGYGLYEDETLAEYVAREFSKAKVYNYSLAGAFPYQILHFTDYIDRIHEIPEKTGVTLYFYFSYHIRRSMGSFYDLSNSHYVHHYYAGLDENGEFKLQGKLRDELWHRFLFLRLFGNSNFFRYYNFELKPTDKDFRIQIAVFRKIQKNLLMAGMKKFYVVIYPWQDELEYTQTLVKYLHEEKIPFIYMGHWDLEQLTEGPQHLMVDGHLSPEANKVVAMGLVPVLRQILSRP